MTGSTVLADQLRAAHTGEGWRTESPDRRLRRARRLPGVHLPEDADTAVVDEALERVLGNDDLLPVNWLTEGLRRADAVGKVDLPGGSGTGFLVSPWLLMTNNHVIANVSDAQTAQVTFGFEQARDGTISSVTKLNLEPDRFFLTSSPAELDFTLVAVQAAPTGRPPGQARGAVKLIATTGKILTGEPVNVIQHPQGRPKEVAFRNNLLVSIDNASRLTYQTDTDAGSSGSPVFNDQWELVALHHSSVEATDAAGTPIDRFGRPVTRNTPEHLRHWVANEGIRVSAIVNHIAAVTYRGEKRTLVDQLLDFGRTP